MVLATNHASTSVMNPSLINFCSAATTSPLLVEVLLFSVAESRGGNGERYLVIDVFVVVVIVVFFFFFVMVVFVVEDVDLAIFFRGNSLSFSLSSSNFRLGGPGSKPK